MSTLSYPGYVKRGFRMNERWTNVLTLNQFLETCILFQQNNAHAITGDFNQIK